MKDEMIEALHELLDMCGKSSSDRFKKKPDATAIIAMPEEGSDDEESMESPKEEADEMKLGQDKPNPDDEDEELMNFLSKMK